MFDQINEMSPEALTELAEYLADETLELINEEYVFQVNSEICEETKELVIIDQEFELLSEEDVAEWIIVIEEKAEQAEEERQASDDAGWLYATHYAGM